MSKSESDDENMNVVYRFWLRLLSQFVHHTLVGIRNICFMMALCGSCLIHNNRNVNGVMSQKESFWKHNVRRCLVGILHRMIRILLMTSEELNGNVVQEYQYGSTGALIKLADGSVLPTLTSVVGHLWKCHCMCTGVLLKSHFAKKPGCLGLIFPLIGRSP